MIAYKKQSRHTTDTQLTFDADLTMFLHKKSLEENGALYEDPHHRLYQQQMRVMFIAFVKRQDISRASNPSSLRIDYSAYRIPTDELKFDRDEINDR